MRVCADIAGVLPILDAIEPGSSSELPWFVMPIARPLKEVLGQSTELRLVVTVVHELAQTLAAMHARDMSHRDIKPDNLFLYQGRWCLGDFGLAHLEGQERLTTQHEKLGPTFYIAPEMLNSAATADGKLADVYSLAKLLWKLATGMGYPLPGHHIAHSPMFSLTTYTVAQGANLLNAIIERATNTDPNARLSMAEFASLLQTWLRPRSTNVNKKIPLNLREHLTLVADAVAAQDAEARQHSMQSAQRLVANRPWVSKLNAFMSDVQTSMIESGLSNVKVVTIADELNCNAAVKYMLGQGALYVSLSHQPHDLPNCRFVGSIDVNFVGPLARHVMRAHSIEYPYLSEGPDAEHAFEVAKDAIGQALNGKLQEFIEIAAGS
jgi:serine/threonine protein kinase